MKVYISADMEGATGVTSSGQCSPKKNEYKRFRKLLTGDVNAAVKGAREAGAEEVLVNDSHGPMTNIMIEELEEKARLISGSNKPLLQMQGIDESFDAAFFVAYHAHEGTPGGVINHTVAGSAVEEITFNGEVVGETGINARIAGYFGVPVVLVTGDDKVAEEAKSQIPKIHAVTVKKGLDRFAGECLPPSETEEMIAEGAEKALQDADNITPLCPEGPVIFRLKYKTTPSAAMAELFPSVKRVGAKTVEIADNDYLMAFKKLWGCIILGFNAAGGVL